MLKLTFLQKYRVQFFDLCFNWKFSTFELFDLKVIDFVLCIRILIVQKFHKFLWILICWSSSWLFALSTGLISLNLSIESFPYRDFQSHPFNNHKLDLFHQGFQLKCSSCGENSDLVVSFGSSRWNGDIPKLPRSNIIFHIHYRFSNSIPLQLTRFFPPLPQSGASYLRLTLRLKFKRFFQRVWNVIVRGSQKLINIGTSLDIQTQISL